MYKISNRVFSYGAFSSKEGVYNYEMSNFALLQISPGPFVAFHKIRLREGVCAYVLVLSRCMYKFIIAYIDSHVSNFSTCGRCKEY